MIETEKLNLEDKLLFEFESELIPPGEEQAITCRSNHYGPFGPIAIYVPIDLAPNFHVKSISTAVGF